VLLNSNTWQHFSCSYYEASAKYAWPDLSFNAPAKIITLQISHKLPPNAIYSQDPSRILGNKSG